MPKMSKRWAALVDKAPASPLSLADALAFVKANSTAKFDESADIAVTLGIDARKSDQVVRGSAVMPQGTGKKVRVAVFASASQADAAKAAGADEVGMEDLAQKIKGGDLDFGVVIATPEAMRVVGTLGQILGPRGLMPNPKVGTVTMDVAVAVANAKQGQVRFRSDRGGVVHCAIGKVSFEVPALQENIEVLIAALRKLKPAGAKGIYINKVTVSSSMGIGVPVDVSSLPG